MNQSSALALLKSGHNVFLTGSAGTGKTYTLNQYIHYLKSRHIGVAVTASTGIAATHLNGMTIHTWSGIGIRDQLTSSDLSSLARRKYLRTQIERAKVLIIDEISMLHGRQLDLVNQVLKHVRKSEQAFGGLQVIVAGDFFQLPPVSKKQERSRDKFAFMSSAWLEAGFKICYLTGQYRQEDQSLDTILNEIRAQQVSPESLALLSRNREQTLSDTTEITRLYTHNYNVEDLNQKFLAELETPVKTFKAKTSGSDALVDSLCNAVRAPELLDLKKGARVMFVKNNFDEGYRNGSLGEIAGFSQDDEHGLLPSVRLKTGELIVAAPATWSVEDEAGVPLATYTQIPLCLAWAITVHKSQGMTLDAAEIDLTHTFENGQGYVALSRLKSLEGLRLLGFNDRAFQLDPLAIKADRRFMELSDLAESEVMALPEPELQSMQDGFVRKCGGLLDADKIDRAEKRLRKLKQGVTASNTLEMTRQLFEEGLTVEEIAIERDLAETTILTHLFRLAQQDKTIDLKRLKPDVTILRQVEKAYRKLVADANPEHFNEDGTLRLKPLHQEAGNDISWQDLRLAMLFIQ